MHFFGYKHNHGTAVVNVDKTSASGHHHVQPATYPPRLPGAGMANVDAFSQPQASDFRTNYDNNSQASVGQGSQFAAENPFHSAQDDPYTVCGVGSGRQGTSRRGIQSMDANNHSTSQTRSSGHGIGGHLAGNVKPATGPIVGSEALKIKGLQKEQEAKVIRLQGGELAEAERLEHEALIHREHAVARGALFPCVKGV